MNKYNVIFPDITNYVHIGALIEIADSLKEGLNDLGVLDSNGKQIWIGAHLEPIRNFIPPNSIIYNTECLSYWMNNDYTNFLKNNEVWSINPATFGKYVPLGYSKCLERIKDNTEKDIDVLFYGCLSQRREQLLTELLKNGLKVVYNQCDYGKIRDEQIAHTKIILNIHYSEESSHLEIPRVSYAMINHKCVVSETANNSIYWPPSSGITFCEYKNITNKINDLLEHLIEIEYLEEIGYQSIFEYKQKDILSKVI